MIEFGRRRYRGVLEDNPAADKSVPDANPDRSFLEVHAFAAVLDAAADLDERRRFGIGRLPAVATLGLAGPLVGELSALRLRDVDLQNARLYIADAKTAAGARHVNIVPKLAEVLEPWWHHRRRGAEGNLDALLWPTDGGRPWDRNSVRNRLRVGCGFVVVSSSWPVAGSGLSRIAYAPCGGSCRMARSPPAALAS